MLRLVPLLLQVVVTLLGLANGFLPGPAINILPRRNYLISKNPSSVMRMANITSTSTPSKVESAFDQSQPVSWTWKSFSSSSAYRIILFTTALLTSQNLRDLLGLPGCVLIFGGALAISLGSYSYDSSFNYLVDVIIPKRQAIVKTIRQVKTDRLSSSPGGGGGGGGRDGDEPPDMNSLLKEYEEILRQELDTRVILPPALWVIPMDEDQEDRFLAPQWLGLKITDQYTLERVRERP